MTVRPAMTAAFAVVVNMTISPDAQANEFCHSDPQPDCLLSLAHDAARMVDDPVQRSDALSQIAIVDAAAGFTDRSRAALDEARYLADSINLQDTVTPRQLELRVTEQDLRTWLYSQIVTAQIKIGWPPEVIDETISSGGGGAERLEIYFAAAQALAEEGRLQDTHTLLAGFLGISDGNPDPTFAMAARIGVAQLLVRMGEYGPAIDTLEQSPMPVETYMYFATVTQIFVEQVRRDDREGALATLAFGFQKAEELPEAAERETVHEMLSRMILPTPTETASSVPRLRPSGHCRGDLSPAGFAVAEAELGFFGSALDTALTIPDPKERDNTLWQIADQQIERSLPDEALTTSRLIGDDEIRDRLIAGIVRAHAMAGDADGAWAAAVEIYDIDRREKLLRRLVTTLMHEGRAAGAARIARDISSAAIRATAYAAIARAMLD